MEASDATGFHVETIRSWTKKGEPRVSTRLVGGKRFVSGAEVLDRAASTTPRRRERTARAELPVLDLDRLSTLEEVARRHRIIDEHRQEIERRHLEIAHQYREIAELALGPRTVPDS